MRKMKRIFEILVFMAVMLIGPNSGVRAQFRFGVKASATLNSMIADCPVVYGLILNSEKSEVSPAFGFNAGGFGEYFISEKFSIVAEVLYARQGVKTHLVEDLFFPADVTQNPEDYKHGTADINCTLTTHHLNIPLMARYYFGNLSFEAGPQISFCFGGREKHHSKYTGEDFVYNHTTDEDFSLTEIEDEVNVDDYRAFNRVNFGMGVGTAYNFDFGMFVSARFNIDFTNTLTHLILENGFGWEVMQSKYWVIALGVGYRF